MSTWAPPMPTRRPSRQQPADEQSKPKRVSSPAQLKTDLTEMLAEIAFHEGKSVWELVEESPLRVWVMERWLKVRKRDAQRTAEVEKALQGLKHPRKD